MTARLKSLALALAAAAAGAACSSRPVAEVDRSQIEIVADKVAIKTGPVGQGRWRSEASYALVEARNRSDRDLDITLAGALVDGSGKTSWPVRRESLRVPAGGTRLFALVDKQQAARPQATSARVEVVGAAPVRFPPPFVVTDGRVVMDQNRAVAAGYVVNTAEKDGSVILIAAFFDQAGAPLGRTSTMFRMASGGKRGVQLVGPPASRSAYLFVGEYVF
jgi:hypothetical protein